MKRILMVLTSHADMDNTDSKTGVWLGEFTDPYYEFIDAGFDVVLASPKGGKPPLDPMSLLTEHITGSNRRFQNDEAANRKFDNTQPLEQVKAEEFDGIFFPGGHGPMWDLAYDEHTGQLITDALQQKKPVAAVCHGPAALLAAEAKQPGLLKGKRLTSFTNTEEALVFRGDNVPYKLETKLKELGADFYSAMVPYASHVETDGLIITGQNPLSAGPTAKEMIKALA